jgi:preprotein translocase subunit SecE
MELKKSPQLPASQKDTSPSASSSSKARVGDVIGDVKAEFKKISWTSPEELKAYTKIVVAATFLFGLGIYFVDVIIKACLGTLEYAIRLITG